MLRLGTWHMAEDDRRRDDELDALRLGLDLGMALIDTAEMYGAEVLVGEAIRGRRDDVFWGVSDFDRDDMDELVSLPGGEAVATDQVLYNLTRRGIELDLLPWCQDRRVPLMAYSPVEQGRLLDDPSLAAVAERGNATPAQVALAWVLRHDGIVTVPKAGTPAHVRENCGASRWSSPRKTVVSRPYLSPTGTSGTG